MSSIVIIAGVEVDLSRPCDVLQELRRVQLQLATGETVSMTRFGDEEVRFSAANSDRLEKLIATYEGLCERSQGRRRRHAMRVTWV